MRAPDATRSANFAGGMGCVLHRRNHTGPILRENRMFCVNTLGAECEAVADTSPPTGAARA